MRIILIALSLVSGLAVTLVACTRAADEAATEVLRPWADALGPDRLAALKADLSRIARSLGARVSVCGPFGGEAGAILRQLAAADGLEVTAVPYAEGSAA